uniref:Reverse transcriptase/retrotransposon-derived protein RNase H-like domain-containing protein n=1 Tax=Sinocyclocheilus anshuiensis TaxID=1608454 RepID=A0A671K0C2_9TELE
INPVVKADGKAGHPGYLTVPLNLTEEAQLHFTALKQAITTAPALGLPDYSKNVHLHAHEAEGVAIGVLLQQHGSTYRPLAYLSKKLDNIASGMPACLRAVAAAALVLMAGKRVTIYTDSKYAWGWCITLPKHGMLGTSKQQMANP